MNFTLKRQIFTTYAFFIFSFLAALPVAKAHSQTEVIASPNQELEEMYNRLGKQIDQLFEDKYLLRDALAALGIPQDKIEEEIGAAKREEHARLMEQHLEHIAPALQLTNTEKFVLVLRLQGKSLDDVAADLGISRFKVRSVLNITKNKIRHTTQLTPRQIRIHQLLRDGKSLLSIAKTLNAPVRSIMYSKTIIDGKMALLTNIDPAVLQSSLLRLGVAPDPSDFEGLRNRFLQIIGVDRRLGDLQLRDRERYVWDALASGKTAALLAKEFKVPGFSPKQTIESTKRRILQFAFTWQARQAQLDLTLFTQLHANDGTSYDSCSEIFD